MTTPNERRTRAGYELFLAANPDNPSHWDPGGEGRPGSPLAAVMDENIEWFDDEGHSGGSSQPITGKAAVLDRLKQLRAEMLSCQILSCSEASVKDLLPGESGLVHTFDHAVKRDDQAFFNTRPHLCASSFVFTDEGKVKTVRYCSADLPPLHLPLVPGGSAS